MCREVNRRVQPEVIGVPAMLSRHFGLAATFRKGIFLLFSMAYETVGLITEIAVSGLHLVV